MNTVRKSVTITKQNVSFVDELVRQQKAKNFSRAVNEALDQRRENNEQKNNNSD